MEHLLGCGSKRKLTDEESATMRKDFMEGKEKLILLRKIRDSMVSNSSDRYQTLDEDHLPETLESDEDKPEFSDPELQQNEDVTFEDVQELAASLPAEGNVEMNYKLLSQFVQLVSQTWKIKMNDRSDEERNCVKGKLEFFLYKSKSVYLNSLMMHLKEFSLPEEILDSFTKIVRYCLDRDYVKANETYSKIATVYDLSQRPSKFALDEILEQKELPLPPKGKIQTNGMKLLIGMCQKYFPSDPKKCDENQETSTTKNN